MTHKRSFYITCALGLLTMSCQQEPTAGFLSSATLESDLWKLAPASSGTLVNVLVREGDSVSMGQLLATVDSIPLILKMAELDAALQQVRANVQARAADNQTLQSTDEGIAREVDRTTKLVAQGAATKQKQDDLETQRATSKARIEAAKRAVDALQVQANLLQAQRKTLLDQISRCYLKSPTAGRVLARYKNPGETALPSRPVLEVGRTDSLWADFFVPQPELGKYRLGQIVLLRIDAGTDAKWIPARINWIASEAEFTPKGVQTREARNELVFRARAMAANVSGILKRGMPIEIWERKAE